MALKESATRYKQKTEILLVIRLPTCWKPDSCFFVCKKWQKGDKSIFVTKKWQKGDKSIFVTKYVRSIVKIIFM